MASHRAAPMIGVVAIAALAAAAGWWGGQQIDSPAEIAAQAAPPEPSLAAVEVEDRVLETNIVVRASFESADQVEITVEAPDESTPIVTAIQLESGSAVDLGQILVEIAERPVVVLSGDLRPFRTMSFETRGDDVLQLEQSLLDLGYDPGEVDGLFSRTTARSVERLYRDLGYKAVKVNGLAVFPRSELVFLGALPNEVDSVLVDRGDLVSGPVVRVTTRSVLARGAISGSDRQLVGLGDHVRLVADDLGKEFGGTIVEIADVSGGDVPAGSYQIGFRPTDGDATDLVGVAVRAIIPLESSGGSVLVVPVAALSAGPDGQPRVAVVRGDESEIVEVTTGLTAGGEVAVSPVTESELKAGDWVVVGATEE